MPRFEIYDVANNCHVRYVRWRWFARYLCWLHSDEGWHFCRLRGWEETCDGR